MDAEELLRRFGLHPPQAFERFVRQIRQLPKFPSKWLYAAEPPEILVQGDVLGPIEYVAVSEENRHGIVTSDVMLVSNTCDLVPGQSDFALAAPVIELEFYTRPSDSTAESWDQHLAAVRRFEVIPYYYLPNSDGLEESFVDLTRIVHLPTPYLADSYRSHQVARKASLTLKGHLLFLAKLAHFLVRLEAREAGRSTEEQ